MSYLVPNSTPAQRARGQSFGEKFISAAKVALNGGTVTGTPVFDFGGQFDGVGDKVAYPIVRGVKSVSFWISLNSTTEDIIKLSSAHSITVSGGTVSATGFSSPTILINGVATSTITTAKSFVTVTTATGFDADDLQVGFVSGFGGFWIKDLQLWTAVQESSEHTDFYTHSTYNYRNQAVLDLPMRDAQHAPLYKVGPELILDSDMSDPLATYWIPNAQSPIVEKVQEGDNRFLRATVTTAAGFGSYYNQSATKLEIGGKYLLTGRARSSGNAQFRIFSGVYIVTVPKSADWEYFSVEITATSTALFFYSIGAIGEYVDSDDISVIKISPRTLDVSGNNNHAVFGAGATLTKLAKRGYSFINDYMVLTDNLSSNQNLTLSLSHRPVYDGSTNYVWFNTDSGGGFGWGVRILAGTAEYQVAHSSGGAVWLTGIFANWGSLEHFSLTLDSSNNATFYRGGQSATQALTIPDRAGDFYLSRTVSSYLGDMYQFVATPEILTPIQVADLHGKMRRSINAV